MHDHLLQGKAEEIRRYFQNEILDKHTGYIVEEDFYDNEDGLSVPGNSATIYNILTHHGTRNMLFHSSTRDAAYKTHKGCCKQYENIYVGLDVKEGSIDIVTLAVPVKVCDDYLVWSSQRGLLGTRPDGGGSHFCNPKQCILEGFDLKQLLTQFPILIMELDLINNIELVLEMIK
jgi:hypothetical protein